MAIKEYSTFPKARLTKMNNSKLKYSKMLSNILMILETIKLLSLQIFRKIRLAFIKCQSLHQGANKGQCPVSGDCLSLAEYYPIALRVNS